MSGYNGSGFGVERGIVNQTIPPTIDGQPLGEIDPDIFKNLIDVTINSEIKKIVSTFDQYKILNYYKDERGNVRMVTKIDTSDDIVIKWEGDYSAYGMLLTGDIENLWLPLKTYALHEHDIVSGLVYAQARWYDPKTGQFISEDPIKDGNNYYSYCGGNPIGMVDPTGLYGQHNPSGVGFGDPDQYYKDLQYGGYNAEQGIYDYSKYKAGITQWQEGAATSHGNDSLDDIAARYNDNYSPNSGGTHSGEWDKYREDSYAMNYGGDPRWFYSRSPLSYTGEKLKFSDKQIFMMLKQAEKWRIKNPGIEIAGDNDRFNGYYYKLNFFDRNVQGYQWYEGNEIGLETPPNREEVVKLATDITYTGMGVLQTLTSLVGIYLGGVITIGSLGLESDLGLGMMYSSFISAIDGLSVIGEGFNRLNGKQNNDSIMDSFMINMGDAVNNISGKNALNIRPIVDTFDINQHISNGAGYITGEIYDAIYK